MNKEMEEKINRNKKTLEYTIKNNLEPEKIKLEKLKKERKDLKELIGEEYKTDPLYMEKVEQVKQSEEKIQGHKKTVKYSIEQIINILRERNKDLYDNYINLNKVQIQQKKDSLITENTNLDFKISHNNAKIEYNLKQINKYREIGDLDRVKELSDKNDELKKENTELKENKSSNTDKINSYKTQEEKAAEEEKAIEEGKKFTQYKTAREEYEYNLREIKKNKDLAKKYDIKLELQPSIKKESSEKGEQKPPTSGTPEPPTSGTPEPPTSGTPEPPTGGTPEPPTSGTPEPPTSGTPEPPTKQDTPIIRMSARKNKATLTYKDETYEIDMELDDTTYAERKKSLYKTLKEAKGIDIKEMVKEAKDRSFNSNWNEKSRSCSYKFIV